MLRAAVITLCLIANLAFWGAIVVAGGVVKLVTFGRARRRLILILTWLVERWMGTNIRILDLFLTTKWDVRGIEGVDRSGHYLVISNHVSWIDIFAVLRAFHGRAPFIRFFLKRVLIWFPIVGQAAWALEFPFMRRYSPEYLRQHPEKRGRDLEATRRFCERYRDIPVTILNYVEGTRFTRDKHDEQASPYRYLLRPRVGGIGFVLACLPGELQAMYDVTLVYPKRDVTFLDLLTNRLPWIVVDARRVDIPPEFHSAAITERGPERERFKQWVEGIWREKDERIGAILSARPDSTTSA